MLLSLLLLSRVSSVSVKQNPDRKKRKILCNFKIFDSNYFIYKSILIRVPKVPFRVFDKWKNEIQKFMIRFCFYHNMKNEI